jgi:hypothetical protein
VHSLCISHLDVEVSRIPQNLLKPLALVTCHLAY